MATSINLSQLPAPGIIETIDIESILAEVKAYYTGLYPQFTADLESEPMVKAMEVFAYRETLLRQRINEAAHGVMLAFAIGPDLDQVGANYNVERLLITPADDSTIPPTAAVYEGDDDYRERIQLSPEGFTTAGSVGSYIYHARSADGDVKDAQPDSPSPGEVVVYVMSRTGNGTASPALLAKVEAALSADEIRPLTDYVQVRTVSIVPFYVDAELTFYEGPDRGVVLQAAIDAVNNYAESVRKIGYDVTVSGLYRALHQSGVQSVDLKHPTASVVTGKGEVTSMTALTVTEADASDV